MPAVDFQERPATLDNSRGELRLEGVDVEFEGGRLQRLKVLVALSGDWPDGHEESESGYLWRFEQ